MDKSETSFRIKWKGKAGQYVEGIPARDLTRAEWDALPHAVQKLAAESGLYQNTPEVADAKPLPDMLIVNTTDGINKTEASELGAGLAQRRKEKQRKTRKNEGN